MREKVVAHRLEPAFAGPGVGPTIFAWQPSHLGSAAAAQKAKRLSRERDKGVEQFFEPLEVIEHAFLVW